MEPEVKLSAILRGVVAVIVTGCLLAGCTSSVVVDFVPPNSPRPAPLAGAESVKLTLIASDRRVVARGELAAVENVDGHVVYQVVAANDIVYLVRSTLEREFRALGFGIGSGGPTVNIFLEEFYNRFERVPLFIFSARADVRFRLKVTNAVGVLLYDQFYSGVGTVGAAPFATGSVAKVALDKAFTNAVTQVIEDGRLQRALLPAP
ncbi:MAG: hypothetical protein HYZ40_15615 [Rhodospirillales bacterium]|nr:hypothetical protein [Rhodospirillales bacterium]